MPQTLCYITAQLAPGRMLYFLSYLLVGMLAVYILLPQPRSLGAVRSAIVGAFFSLFGLFLFMHRAASVETFLFYAFATIAIVAGVMFVTQRNPVRAALSFALVVLSTCGLFLLQAAPFLMAATIIIYAGAIIVTFVFVIMLAQQAGVSDADLRSREPFLSCLASFFLLGAILLVLQSAYDNELLGTWLAQKNELPDQEGVLSLPADNVAALGRALFTDYLLPVELGGTLLLVATIGAIAIAARRPEGLR